MKDELDKALKELAELYDFYIDIAELPAEEMVEKIEERDPEFIEHIEAMENPPQSGDDFWFGYGIWSMSRLHSKYRPIWGELIDAYFHSDVRRQQREKWSLSSAMWTKIDEILKNSDF